MNVPIQELLNSLSLGKFYSYNGGLTTPPCTEGVNWTVLSEPVPISASVANSIKSRYQDRSPGFAPYCTDCSQGNNRQTMPVNGRKVYLNDNAIMTALSAMTFGALATLLM